MTKSQLFEQIEAGEVHCTDRVVLVRDTMRIREARKQARRIEDRIFLISAVISVAITCYLMTILSAA